MKIVYVIWILYLPLTYSLFGQEVLIPSSSNVKDKVLFTKENNEVIGEGFFPVSYNEANYSLPMKDTLRNQSWIVRKLVNEHFVQLQKEDFLLTIDPLFNLSIGKELLQEMPHHLFQNTRGAQAFAQIKDKLSIYTAFYENQARFVDYQSEYFTSRGELYPKNDSVYVKDNAMIPGGGRTKPFKEHGFDYASAVSYIRFTPINQLAIQFGNMPRFFGWGYRSMLMSDNSHNYTHLSIDWKITKRLSYTFMRGKQLNLFRKVYSTLVEKPYERKGIGVHYLSYKVNPSLVIGFFESTVFLRDKAKSDQRVNPIFYNPIIGLNTLIFGMEKEDVKNLFGFNLAWKLHPQHMIYAQGITDDVKNFEYGFQLGYRTGNTFGIKNLHFQLEYNQASDLLYAAHQERMAYTHFNLPIAHTLGNGFKELLIRASYEWKRIFIEASTMFYLANEEMVNKHNLFTSKSENVMESKVDVLHASIEGGYVVNPATQLRVFIHGNYRASRNEHQGSLNYGTIYLGIRSALTNRYFDF